MAVPRVGRAVTVGWHRMGESRPYFRRPADLDAAVLAQLVAGSVAAVRRRHPDPEGA